MDLSCFVGRKYFLMPQLRTRKGSGTRKGGGTLRMPLGQRIADMAPLCRSGSLGDLFRAQVGYAELA